MLSAVQGLMLYVLSANPKHSAELAVVIAGQLS